MSKHFITVGRVFGTRATFFTIPWNQCWRLLSNINMLVHHDFILPIQNVFCALHGRNQSISPIFTTPCTRLKQITFSQHGPYICYIQMPVYAATICENWQQLKLKCRVIAMVNQKLNGYATTRRMVVDTVGYTTCSAIVVRLAFKNKNIMRTMAHGKSKNASASEWEPCNPCCKES